MMKREGGHFDPETIALLTGVLDETWADLAPQEQALTTKSFLARRILYLARNGERDPVRLRTRAVMDLTV